MFTHETPLWQPGEVRESGSFLDAEPTRAPAPGDSTEEAS